MLPSPEAMAEVRVKVLELEKRAYDRLFRPSLLRKTQTKTPATAAQQHLVNGGEDDALVE